MVLVFGSICHLAPKIQVAGGESGNRADAFKLGVLFSHANSEIEMGLFLVSS